MVEVALIAAATRNHSRISNADRLAGIQIGNIWTVSIPNNRFVGPTNEFVRAQKPTRTPVVDFR